MPMPGVFSAPIRNDLVHFVHSELSKNRRQGHAVFHKAGQEHSAESWGTGRAVARIPRIGGSGTSRSGQATFGNMCRKARMFAPLKIWRKWHRRVNLTQRRHAVAAALAASACAPLVTARGHALSSVPELPLIIENLNVPNTKSLVSALHCFGLGHESRRHRRAGQGKMRNSLYVTKKGPLIIYGDQCKDLKKAARNLQGVDTCHVDRLNIIQLAPGGHLGRLVIFTKCAFGRLNALFGSHFRNSVAKQGYHMNRNLMACADLSRIINSDQVQAKLREQKCSRAAHNKTNANPLTNRALMNRLNPFEKQRVAIIKKREEDRHKARAAAVKAKRKAGKKDKVARNKEYNALQQGLVESFKAAQDIIDADEKAGNYVPGDTSEEDE